MTAVPHTVGEAHFDHGTTVAVLIRQLLQRRGSYAAATAN
jgi:hypothetical protein